MKSAKAREPHCSSDLNADPARLHLSFWRQGIIARWTSCFPSHYVASNLLHSALLPPSPSSVLSHPSSPSHPNPDRISQRSPCPYILSFRAEQDSWEPCGWWVGASLVVGGFDPPPPATRSNPAVMPNPTMVYHVPAPGRSLHWMPPPHLPCPLSCLTPDPRCSCWLPEVPPPSMSTLAVGGWCENVRARTAIPRLGLWATLPPRQWAPDDKPWQGWQPTPHNPHPQTSSGGPSARTACS